MPSHERATLILGLRANGDLAALMFLRLRHQNAEDTVLHAGFDVVLVNTTWEGEGTSELPYATFRHPQLGLVFGLMLLLLILCDNLGAGSCVLLE